MNKDLILREKLALQRTILANQATFLAFIRTSMYFLVAGISINNLTTLEYRYLVELVFIGISATLFIIGIVNYKKQSLKIIGSEKYIGNYQEEYITEKK